VLRKMSGSAGMGRFISSRGHVLRADPEIFDGPNGAREQELFLA